MNIANNIHTLKALDKIHYPISNMNANTSPFILNKIMKVLFLTTTFFTTVTMFLNHKSKAIQNLKVSITPIVHLLLAAENRQREIQECKGEN